MNAGKKKTRPMIYRMPRSKGPDNSVSPEGVYGNGPYMHTSTLVIGNKVTLLTQSGQEFEGIFKTFSPQFDVVLEVAHRVDPADPSKINTAFVYEKLIVKSVDIISIKVKNADLEYATRDTFQTDTSISRYNGQIVGEKELEPWLSTECGQDMDLEKDCANGWDAHDMFKKNETMYGVQSDFDSTLTGYTTQLNKKDTKDYKDAEAEATRIASEIENSPSYRTRADLENGDEEAKFSAVYRPSPTSSVVNASSNGKYVTPQRRNKTMQGNPKANRSGGPPSSHHVGSSKPPPVQAMVSSAPVQGVGGYGLSNSMHSNAVPASPSPQQHPVPPTQNSQPMQRALAPPGGAMTGPPPSQPHATHHTSHHTPHHAITPTPPQHQMHGPPVGGHAGHTQVNLGLPPAGQIKVNGVESSSGRSAGQVTSPSDPPAVSVKSEPLPQRENRHGERRLPPTQAASAAAPTVDNRQAKTSSGTGETAAKSVESATVSHEGGAPAPNSRLADRRGKGQEDVKADLKKFGQHFKLSESTDTSKKGQPSQQSVTQPQAPPPQQPQAHPPPLLSQPPPHPHMHVPMHAPPPVAASQPPPTVATQPPAEVAPQPATQPQQPPTPIASVVVPSEDNKDAELERAANTLKKSTLNPNAKEFILNPNAKAFTPRSPSAPTPPRPHTPQTPQANMMVSSNGGVMLPTYVFTTNPPSYQQGSQRFRKGSGQFHNRLQHLPGVPISMAHHRPEMVSNVAAATGQPILAQSAIPGPHFTTVPYAQGTVPILHGAGPYHQMMRMVTPQGGLVPMMPGSLGYHEPQQHHQPHPHHHQPLTQVYMTQPPPPPATPQGQQQPPPHPNPAPSPAQSQPPQPPTPSGGGPPPPPQMPHPHHAPHPHHPHPHAAAAGPYSMMFLPQGQALPPPPPPHGQHHPHAAHPHAHHSLMQAPMQMPASAASVSMPMPMQYIPQPPGGQHPHIPTIPHSQ